MGPQQKIVNKLLQKLKSRSFAFSSFEKIYFFIKTNMLFLLNYNWLSFRVVVVVVIVSDSPFSWPFDIDVIIDLMTTLFELVSVVSLENESKTLELCSEK